MPVTVRGTDILFNDGSTQSTAAGGVPTFDSIGSYGLFWISSSTATSAGSTVSGSFLFRATAGPLTTGQQPNSPGSNLYLTAFPGLTGDYRNRTTALSSGASTLSPVSGTWRLLARSGGAAIDGYSNTMWPAVLAVRVA